MKKTFLLVLSGALLTFTSCSNDDDGTLVDNPTEENPTEETPTEGSASANFTVTIENVITPQPIFQSGVFNTPVGADGPGPIFPTDAYEFEIDAGPRVLPAANGDMGTRLSFMTMFIQSNDLFYAPNEEGIALYDADGNPIGADGPEDVTDQVLLWDAGTEVNEETGGMGQKPQQEVGAVNVGEDENGVVTEVVDNVDSFGNVIPDNDAVIQVTIENIAPARFRVRILNVSDGMTIATTATESGTAAVPLSPGNYAVHTGVAPFFTTGESATASGAVASERGVEDIAEEGDPTVMAMDTEAKTGLIVPLSPGAFAVHAAGIQPLYQIDTPDFGEGLEGVAEDGTPGTLVESLLAKEGVSLAELFNTPDGADAPGPVGPGASYSFTFTATDGDNLSFATMFIQSNDWFYAFRPDGLSLFEDGAAISGDVTENVFLYDSGTEIDEYPGAGLSQVIRQGEANSGEADPDNTVRFIDPAVIMQNVPATENSIRVTISSEPSI